MNWFIITGYLVVLVIISFIDLKKRLILDRITYPVTVGVLILALYRGNFWDALWGGLAAALLMIGFVVLLSGTVGMGDVKLAMLTGTMVGFPYSLAVVGLSWVVGILFIPLFKKSGSAPFAPAISLSAIVILTALMVK